MSKHNRERRQLRAESKPVQVAAIGMNDVYPMFKVMGEWAKGVGPKRACGDCSECCTAMGVETLHKPPNATCEYVVEGKGCGCYGQHPDECKTYACLWKMGWSGDDDRPDRNGVLISIGPHPSLPDRDSLELIELRDGAIVSRFPDKREVYSMVPPDLVTIVVVPFGTPRARTVDAPPRYCTEGNCEGMNNYVGTKKLLIQLGVLTPSGDLKTSRGVVPADQVEGTVQVVIADMNASKM